MTKPKSKNKASKKKITEKLQLPVALTEKELNDRGQKLAAKLKEFAALDIEKKASAKVFKGRMDLIANEVEELRDIISKKEEDRMILCEVIRDFKLNEVRYIRSDNGQIGKKRAMTQAERQEELDLKEKKKKDAEKVVEAAKQKKQDGKDADVVPLNGKRSDDNKKG